MSRWGLLLALPLLAAGGWLTGIGAGVYAPQQGTAVLPPWLVVVIGLIFFAAGLYLAGDVLRSISRRLLVGRARKATAPWRFDFRWRRHRAVHDGSGAAAYSRLAGAGAFGAMVAVLHAPLFLEPDATRLPVMLYVVLGIFDLIALALLLHALAPVVHRLRYGRTQVRLNAFPFYIGGALEVTFEGGASLADMRGLRATLRCVEEAIETHGRGKDSTTHLVCYQLYGDERSFDTDRQGRASLAFLLPADLPGNRLPETPPTYWEIEVRMARSGVDYGGTFLMPVYQRGRGPD